MCALGASGCLSQIIPAHEPAVREEPALQTMLQQGGFLGAGFVKIDRAPFPSELEPGRMVEMYVSANAAAAYQSVTPDGGSGGAGFPVGGTIVRAVSDGGALAALSVMVKREAGYFPAVGDFFFGVSDVDGNPMSDDEHGLLWGKLGFCADCHETRASSGFLFGVARADR
jgi:hypothetical protein